MGVTTPLLSPRCAPVERARIARLLLGSRRGLGRRRPLGRGRGFLGGRGLPPGRGSRALLVVVATAAARCREQQQQKERHLHEGVHEAGTSHPVLPHVTFSYLALTPEPDRTEQNARDRGPFLRFGEMAPCRGERRAGLSDNEPTTQSPNRSRGEAMAT